MDKSDKSERPAYDPRWHEEIDLDLTPEEDERFAAAVVELGKTITPEQRKAERRRLLAWERAAWELAQRDLAEGRDTKLAYALRMGILHPPEDE